jgi:hypothetical protein
VNITDARGRTITIKKPGVLAQYRLIECLGDTAKNETYVSMVLPLIYVAAIDGEALPPIMRKSEVEALVQRLDEHGLAALMAGIEANFAAPNIVAPVAAIPAAFPQGTAQ